MARPPAVAKATAGGPVAPLELVQNGYSSEFKPSSEINHRMKSPFAIFLGILRASFMCLVAAGIVASAQASFIETYDDGTDVGLWVAAFSVPRTIEPSGGNPGAYLQQGGFSSHVPTWASISTRFQPGVNDPFKTDSIQRQLKASYG